MSIVISAPGAFRIDAPGAYVISVASAPVSVSLPAKPRIGDEVRIVAPHADQAAVAVTAAPAMIIAGAGQSATDQISTAFGFRLYVWAASGWISAAAASGGGDGGTPGADGADGADGASAYDLWIANGNSGDQATFLTSLIGADGINGADGADGINGADGADGAQGPTGIDGADGASIVVTSGPGAPDDADGQPDGAIYIQTA